MKLHATFIHYNQTKSSYEERIKNPYPIKTTNKFQVSVKPKPKKLVQHVSLKPIRILKIKEIFTESITNGNKDSHLHAS